MNIRQSLSPADVGEYDRGAASADSELYDDGSMAEWQAMMIPRDRLDEMRRGALDV